MSGDPPIAGQQKGQRCPLGGPRCPEQICDCFIEEHPDDPLALHPEYYRLVLPEDDS